MQSSPDSLLLAALSGLENSMELLVIAV